MYPRRRTTASRFFIQSTLRLFWKLPSTFVPHSRWRRRQQWRKLAFRLGSYLKLINAIRSWCLLRRWLPVCVFSRSLSLPPSGLLTDREIYSKSCQFCPGNSISSKNDPPSLLLPTLLVSSSIPVPSPSPLCPVERNGEREKRFKPPRDFFRWKISGFLIQATVWRVASVKCTWFF